MRVTTSSIPSTAAASPPPPPPPYTPELRASSTRTTRVPPQPARPVPAISLLFLGSPGVGKATFISQIPRVRNGGLQPPPLTPWPEHATSTSAGLANPTTYSVSLFARPYDIAIYRSTSTLFIDPFPPKIDALVLCYAVDDRSSLFNVQKYWRRIFAEKYEVELGLQVPVLLLGLKRDLRTVEKQNRPQAQGDVLHADDSDVGTPRAYLQASLWTKTFSEGRDTPTSTNKGWDDGVGGEMVTTAQDEEYVCVMPDEAVRVANEMRCDRYAECSALTGELLWEALEDITRMAALTTTSSGGFSEGPGCTIM